MRKWDRIPAPYSTLIAILTIAGGGFALYWAGLGVEIAITLVAGAILAVFLKWTAEASDQKVFSAILGTEVLVKDVETAKKSEALYSEKMEEASGDEIFKYILLINVSSMERYVAQTRIQAEQSFVLCKRISLTGFIMIAFGIALGVYLTVATDNKMDVAYLSASAGIIAEFISGVFFFLYSRTLQQINRFQNRLAAMQQTAMSILLVGNVNDENKRDDTKAELSQALLNLASSANFKSDSRE